MQFFFFPIKKLPYLCGDHRLRDMHRCGDHRLRDMHRTNQQKTTHTMKLTNKFAAEFFGTAVLVLGGCGTAMFGHVGFLGVALAFGLTIVAAAYGIGHISGAHLNPAVSLGVFVNGRMSAKEMLTYWCAQILGATAAAASRR